ncbi:hypothetical protein [Streptomyces syringium]|uniref:hypothetical protein n=1 Tax=Streptomyces syringium TaxID=76729 RepID=UPI0033D09837
MNTTKRALTAVALTGAALTMTPAAQADTPDSNDVEFGITEHDIETGVEGINRGLFDLEKHLDMLHLNEWKEQHDEWSNAPAS